ncbi:SsrA-binding protein [Candidatus Peregrinibacteria bacterium CG11_big_fil_rev_8_21_14_0_20_41_10]|nr:MAG: SsrA-binding protein [Candidatus Peregrinibacteria bacterium CG11_big_fil_rev_8_21_14_0_20_41_10]PIZ74230.1 MAG: SsrA-binding protein [Candidatus Peregrinibacteria bacterium CG_4_10_14_0_2_um_filter_41_8]
MSFAKNKKAYRDYEILEEFEAGVKFMGPEVKSVRRGLIQMGGSYVALLTDGPYVMGIHISPYKFSHDRNLDPTRKRKLLLNQKEINAIQKAESTSGLTIIPLEFYPKGGLIKLKIAIAKGRKQHDKRQVLKEKDVNRRIDRTLKARYK